MCVDIEKPIVVANVVDVFTCGGEKLVQPNRLQRFPARCWILDIFGVPVRICGRFEFTASEQQADD